MPPEDVENLNRLSAEALHGGRPYSFECRFRRISDGSLRWYLVRCVPVRNASGEIVKWLGTSTDIDEQKRAAEALRLSEWRLRFTLDAAMLGSWEFNLQTNQVDFSHQCSAIFGYGDSAPQWTYGRVLELIVTEDLDKVKQKFRESLDLGGEFNVECRIRRASDGAIRWLWVCGRRVPDDSGIPDLVLGLAGDITERKEAEAALAQANDELTRANSDLEQFGYSASHDLQEPLRSVMIYSQLLARDYEAQLDGPALEMLGYLRGGASRMERLIRDLLAYTQVRKLEIPEDTDAMQAVGEALANLASAIAETGATVEYQSLPAVPIHKVHLQQIFQNLIGNALKYRSERAPVIRIAAERRERHWLFSVRDNGIGIAAEYLEQIFGLFKRLHAGDGYSGTGIGLAICKRTVERHGGRIWVASDVGKGSTFYFTLPF
jgi:PAS domain S-box-containing protein